MKRSDGIYTFRYTHKNPVEQAVVAIKRRYTMLQQFTLFNWCPVAMDENDAIEHRSYINWAEKRTVKDFDKQKEKLDFQLAWGMMGQDTTTIQKEAKSRQQ